MILSTAMNRVEDPCIPIRPSEEMEEFDWIIDETDDEGYRVVVQAVPLHECRSAEIVAVYIDRSCPVNYLMDSDGILYYVGKSSRVMDLYFPMTDYLKWRNSWTMVFPFLAREPFPVGWRYYQGIISTVCIIVSDTIWKEFMEACSGREPYREIICAFPRVIEQALRLRRIDE